MSAFPFPTFSPEMTTSVQFLVCYVHLLVSDTGIASMLNTYIRKPGTSSLLLHASAQEEFLENVGSDPELDLKYIKRHFTGCCSN